MQQAIEAAKESQTAKRGSHSTQACGRARIARSRLAMRLKFDTGDADLQRLERAMSFLTVSRQYTNNHN